MTDVVTVSTVGLAEKERTVLTVAANLMAAYDVDIKTLTDGDTSGQVVLLDSGQAMSFVSQGAQIVVQVDGTPGAVSSAHARLERPLRVQVFKELLEDLVQHHASELESARLTASAQPAVAAEKSSAPVSTGRAGGAITTDTLFGAMALAVDDAISVAFVLDGAEILLDGVARTFTTSLDDAALVRCASEGGGGVSIKTLSASDMAQKSAGLTQRPFSELAWMAAFLRAPGKNYTGTSEHSRFKLTVWPRFPSQYSRPEFMRLGAMVTRNGMSMHELNETSGISMSIIHDFFHLLLILGIVEFTLIQDAPSAETEAAKPGSARKGLFAMIAKKLSFG